MKTKWRAPPSRRLKFTQERGRVNERTMDTFTFDMEGLVTLSSAMFELVERKRYNIPRQQYDSYVQTSLDQIPAPEGPFLPLANRL